MIHNLWSIKLKSSAATHSSGCRQDGREPQRGALRLQGATSAKPSRNRADKHLQEDYRLSRFNPLTVAAVKTERSLTADGYFRQASLRFAKRWHAAALICSAALPLWAADSGTAKVVRGDVRIERAGSSAALKVGDPVLEKDRIVVAAEGSAGITLRDDTRISVGPRSTLVINGFSFDSKTQEGNVDTSILRGTMRYVTGLVGRFKPTSVRVATATATVGIRGTDFIIEVADGE